MKRREFLQGAAGLPAAAGWSAQAGAGGGFRAGFAERDITPEIGMEQPGGYGKSFHKSFHDPCKVRASVFDDGRNRVALVGIDTLVVPRPLAAGARKEIEERSGIAGEAVMIGASHSHSSGPVGMVLPGEYDHATELVRELAYKKSSMADAGYLERVRKAIADAVCEANQKREESLFGAGSGFEDKVAFNRRFRMKNGLTYTHPGKGNPDIIGPAGPVDPEVGVVGVWDRAGRLKGCVVNYVCHATTSPGGISANWIYYLEKAIRGVFDDAVVVFLQGASGDVTQVDNLSAYADPGPEQWCRLVGATVGAEAVKVLLRMPVGTDVAVAAKTKTWRVGRRIPSPGRVKRCLEMVRKDPKEVGVTKWTFAKEIVMLDALIQASRDVEVEVQAVQTGPAVFLANPAEYFCQFGLEIKKGSRFPFTWPVELANGCVGYVPTEEALGKGGGGYETRLTAYSNLEATAGSQIRDACIALAGQLTPGPVVKRAPAPPSRGPWEYGSVAPEVS